MTTDEMISYLQKKPTTDDATNKAFQYIHKNMQPNGQVNLTKPTVVFPLFQSNKVAYVDSVLNANKNKDFVKRMFEQNTPSIQDPLRPNDKNARSTHLMSYDPKSKRAYPTIVNRNGKLEYLGNEDAAWDYADKTGEYIEFPTANEAKWFSENGYKQGTNVLKSYKK